MRNLSTSYEWCSNGGEKSVLRNTLQAFWSLGPLGYCEYLSDDIQFILESTTSDSINATGIEAVTNILNGCRDALNSDPFDGFWHETKSVKFIKITDNCVKAEIFLHIWQRIKATREWKQQIFNKMVDKEPKQGRFPIFVTTEKRDGKWLVTEQRANTDDWNNQLTISNGSLNLNQRVRFYSFS